MGSKFSSDLKVTEKQLHDPVFPPYENGKVTFEKYN